MAWNKEDRERLVEIWKEMLDLGEEVKGLIRTNGSRFDYEHAKSYWLGSILAGLDNGEYMESNTFRKYLEDTVGYDPDNDTFEDVDPEDCEDEEDEEEESSCTEEKPE